MSAKDARIAELEAERDEAREEWLAWCDRGELAENDLKRAKARIAYLEGEVAAWKSIDDSKSAILGGASDRIAELEEALREIATASGWGSNGFDLDGEFRLSRKAMKSLARRALGEDA